MASLVLVGCSRATTPNRGCEVEFINRLNTFIVDNNLENPAEVQREALELWRSEFYFMRTNSFSGYISDANMQWVARVAGDWVLRDIERNFSQEDTVDTAEIDEH